MLYKYFLITVETRDFDSIFLEVIDSRETHRFIRMAGKT